MVVVVLVAALLVPVLICEAIDSIRGAAVGGLWTFLALAGLVSAVALAR
jgi:hypothetical protein